MIEVSLCPSSGERAHTLLRSIILTMNSRSKTKSVDLLELRFTLSARRIRMADKKNFKVPFSVLRSDFQGRKTVRTKGQKISIWADRGGWW